MKKKHILKSILCSTFLILLTSHISAMELIVFESSLPAYNSGSAIHSSETVQLDVGQTMTLIAPNGNIIKLAGLYNEPALSHNNDNNQDISKALKTLITANKTHAKDMGVTRNTSDVIRSSSQYGWVPEPWVVNISRDGDNCIKEGMPVKLWRSSPEPGKLNASLGNEFAAHTNLKENQVFISVSPEMPVVDGGNYQFTMEKQVNTTWHIIPKDISSDLVIAAWMDKVGCKAQAQAMLTNY